MTCSFIATVPVDVTFTGVDTGTLEERSSVLMSATGTWIATARDEQAFLITDDPSVLEVIDTQNADEPEMTLQDKLTGSSYQVLLLDEALISVNFDQGVEYTAL